MSWLTVVRAAVAVARILVPALLGALAATGLVEPQTVADVQAALFGS